MSTPEFDEIAREWMIRVQGYARPEHVASLAEEMERRHVPLRSAARHLMHAVQAYVPDLPPRVRECIDDLTPLAWPAGSAPEEPRPHRRRPDALETLLLRVLDCDPTRELDEWDDIRREAREALRATGLLDFSATRSEIEKR